MNNRYFLTLSVCFGILLPVIGKSNPVDEGKTIFSSRCAACHNVNVKVVGPPLAGVDTRHDIDWIINFVHSSQTMVKKNDKDAVALFNEYNSTIMPDHPDLSADQIKNVVNYIKAQAAANPASAQPFRRPHEEKPGYQPVSIDNYSFFFTYVVLAITLAGVLVVAVKVKELQRPKDGEQA